MKDIKFIYLSLLLGFLSFMTACDDDSPSAEKKRNQWVFNTMSDMYFWEDKISVTDGNTNENTFDFFDKLVYQSGIIDRWSFITDDHAALVNLLAGVYKSTGYSIRPYYRDGDTSNEVVCIIEYVEPDSPADIAGLERGDVFYQINGQTLNDENFYDLVYLDEQVLTLGVINQDFSVSEISPKINITAIELTTYPILKTNIVEYGGKKIGYLAYTSFIAKYNDDLKAVFADFKSQGIDELVLDLRYNSGGSVETAILLCSMIAPASQVGDILLKGQYNEAVTDYFAKKYGEESLIDRIIEVEENLNLSRLVVLTTRNTASASEMVIYGLKPHMEVIQIGEQTHGKYYASATFTDDAIYNWAMQPIIFRTENRDNSINYNEGLVPDSPVQDLALVFDQQPVYELGDAQEEFFALAIEQLTGVVPQGASLKSNFISAKPVITGTKLGHSLKYDMHYTLKK